MTVTTAVASLPTASACTGAEDARRVQTAPPERTSSRHLADLKDGETAWLPAGAGDRWVGPYMILKVAERRGHYFVLHRHCPGKACTATTTVTEQQAFYGARVVIA